MIKEFLEYSRNVRGLAPKTLQEYEKELRTFSRWGASRGLRWSTITKQDVDAYTAYLNTCKCAVRTIKKRVSVVRCIFRWAVHEGLLAVNPAEWCQTPKIKEDLPQIADLDHVNLYLTQAPKSYEDRVVHLVTAIIIETGCRIGEVLAIRNEDIDIDRRCIVIHGKGGSEREVYYSDRTAYALEHWATWSDGTIVDGMPAETIRYAMYRTLGRYCPRVHPHQLRHTFATAMINRGMDIKTLGCLLGHKHVETTEIYAKVSSQHMAEMYNKYIF